MPEAGSSTIFEEATLVVYDLQDPEAWERAREERRAWGRERTEIYALDNDHVLIEFLEASA